MYKYLKRPLDFILAFIGLIIISSILILVIIILSFTGEHEIFYLQERVGYKNRKFKIWKFATMVKDSPNIGTGSLTTCNDPRVTKFGKLLRSTKINELPQLINVLIGNMSLVGPRPQMEVDFLKFPLNIQQHIYDVKPGITGIGSVIFRDEEKLITESGEEPHLYYKKHIAPYKGELEIWYQNHLTLLTDIKLIFITIFVIPFSESNIPYRMIKTLPTKPTFLK
jgi:lipopolysaccharide/colanic/teichoic acid biosynthesis glycosyltransferase